MTQDYRERQVVRDREWREAWAALSPDARAAMEAKMGSSDDAPVQFRNGHVLHETASEPAPQGTKETVGRREDAGEMAEHHADFRSNPDIAAAVDSLADQLREQFGLTSPAAAQFGISGAQLDAFLRFQLRQCERIAAWHEEQVRLENQRQAAMTLGRVVGFLLLPGNLRLRAHGLAHAARMAKRNGLTSLRASAIACGVTQTAMCNVAWKCVELLGLPPLEGAKSGEAKEKYRNDKKTNHWRTQKCKLEKRKTAK